jgi:hypothetical protein
MLSLYLGYRSFEQVVHASPPNFEIDWIEEDSRLDFVSPKPALRFDLRKDTLTFPGFNPYF